MSPVLNGGNKILAQGTPGLVILEEAAVTANATGLATVKAGSIFSYQSHALTGNVGDGAPTECSRRR